MMTTNHQPTTATMNDHQRPWGVWIIALLLLLLVLLKVSLYAAAIALDDPTLLGNTLLGELPVATWPKGVMVALAAGDLLWHSLLAISFWQLRRWAWIWVMISCGYTLTQACWNYFQGQPDYITMWLNVIMVLYLNQREVQRVFQKTMRQREAV